MPPTKWPSFFATVSIVAATTASFAAAEKPGGNMSKYRGKACMHCVPLLLPSLYTPVDSFRNLEVNEVAMAAAARMVRARIGP